MTEVVSKPSIEYRSYSFSAPSLEACCTAMDVFFEANPRVKYVNHTSHSFIHSGNIPQAEVVLIVQMPVAVPSEKEEE